MVFLEAGLYPKLPGTDQVAVLEIGMGSGLNAFLTLLEAETHEKHISYTGYEAYPLAPSEASQLNYPARLGVEFRSAQFLYLHRSDWGEPHEITPYFTFQKERQRFETITDEDRYDVIYFDAFAPTAQPELWDATMMARMFHALRRGGILTTYCAKGTVKRALKEVGFRIESLPGPPGKREMTRAWKD